MPEQLKIPGKTTYIFDFDGTLVDSMPTWAQKMLRLLDTNGIAYPPDIIRTITPLGDRGTALYFIEKLHLPLSPEEIFRQMDAYAGDAYAHRIPAKPGVPETLRRLRAAGCSLHVLTASPHKMLDVCLRRLGLFDLFDNVWSCDDFDTTKADVKIYTRAAAEIGVPVGDCVFADDNLRAVQTAKAAGMTVVGVFDETSAAEEPAMRAAADLYVRALPALFTD